MKYWKLATAVAIVGMMSIGCAAENGESMTAAFEAQKAEMMASLEQNMEKVGQELEELKSAAAAAGENVDQAMQDRIAELEMQKQKLSNQMAELETVTAETWDEWKTNMSAAMDDMKDASHDAMEKMEDTAKEATSGH